MDRFDQITNLQQRSGESPSESSPLPKINQIAKDALKDERKIS